MESKFDYNAFKAQHDLHRAVLQLTRTLEESRNEQNQRIFPRVPGQPGPFDALLDELRIARDEDAHPQFDFELH